MSAPATSPASPPSTSSSSPDLDSLCRDFEFRCALFRCLIAVEAKPPNHLRLDLVVPIGARLNHISHHLQQLNASSSVSPVRGIRVDSAPQHQLQLAQGAAHDEQLVRRRLIPPYPFQINMFSHVALAPIVPDRSQIDPSSRCFQNWRILSEVAAHKLSSPMSTKIPNGDHILNAEHYHSHIFIIDRMVVELNERYYGHEGDQLHFYVTDLTRSAEFYQRLLNLPVKINRQDMSGPVGVCLVDTFTVQERPYEKQLLLRELGKAVVQPGLGDASLLLRVPTERWEAFILRLSQYEIQFQYDQEQQPRRVSLLDPDSVMITAQEVLSFELEPYKKKAEDNGDEKAECPVCLEALTDVLDVWSFSCRHGVCRDCIMKLSNGCPVCRSSGPFCRFQDQHAAAK